MNSSRIRNIIIVGVVFVAIGIIVGLTVKVMPVEASAESVSVDSLFSFMLAIATVVFLIVEGGIIYSIVRFRRKPGDDTDGPPLHGNTALEITWTAIPTLIVFVLTVYSYKVYADNLAPQPNETTINVTGQQFTWSFTYPYQNDPKLTPEQNIAAEGNMVSNELHLAVGRPVVVDIQSKDVMHSFYIPEFRVKQDAIPGRTTIIRFTPTVAGTYNVVCTELCGQGHSTMHNTVVVEDPAQYDAYVANLVTIAKQGATDPRRAERGKQLIVSGKYPCGSCHTITDAGTAGIVGPKLDGVATRAATNQDDRLTKSNVTTAADYLRVSIEHPSLYLVPGFQDLMPKNFGDPTVMPDDDREAIVNYLLTLK